MQRALGPLLGAMFLLGLAAHGSLFAHSAREGDERIYVALVEQLDAGRGYTLVGHPLLNGLPRESYGRPLFFHPPGGPVVFWAAYRVFGQPGFALVQLGAYAVFFWATLLATRHLVGSDRPVVFVGVGALAAVEPLVAHVTTRFWLDGPLVAMVAFVTASMLAGLGSGRCLLLVLAALALGFAGLIKATALLAVPGLLALAWAHYRLSARALGRLAALFLGVFALVQVPWLWLEHARLGTIWPGWAGRPAPILVAENAFVRYVTLGRSPWFYVRALPFICASLVPSALACFFWRDPPGVRRRGLALVGWIMFVTLFHVALGAIGYSKVLRYVILVAPASVLLFGLALAAALARAPSSGRVALVTLVLVGGGLEVAQGVKTLLVDDAEMILPLIGRERDRPSEPVWIRRREPAHAPAAFSRVSPRARLQRGVPSERRARRLEPFSFVCSASRLEFARILDRTVTFRSTRKRERL